MHLVHRPNATGVSLVDLLGAIWAYLWSPIVHADFWNEELSGTRSPRRGGCGVMGMRSNVGAVRRADFLRRHGLWETKTRKT